VCMSARMSANISVTYVYKSVTASANVIMCARVSMGVCVSTFV